ncbi:unnamed protein product, partial [Hapterophycus canaliculatus]
IVGEVASFLEPRAVLSYSMTCTTADGALWQDECWRGLFDVRHLSIVGADTFPSDGTNSHDDRDDAPIRRAVIAYGCLLCQALRLFDMVIADRGTTKAVINGPARTAVAVASLQALADITVNASDPVGRKAFSNIRTGQLLFSILAREHSSAVMQELTCAVLANLFCQADTTPGVCCAGQPAHLGSSETIGFAARNRRQGRNKGSAIQTLTGLCSSTRPSPSSWITPKHSGGGGMRPVENIPGRQASRALINLLLPQFQVRQQQGMLRKDLANNHAATIKRRRSLPDQPPPQNDLQRETNPTERPPVAHPVPASDDRCEGRSQRVKPSSTAAAWEEDTEDEASRSTGPAAPCTSRIRGPERGRAFEGGVPLPPVTVSVTRRRLVHLSTTRTAVEDGRTTTTMVVVSKDCPTSVERVAETGVESAARLTAGRTPKVAEARKSFPKAPATSKPSILLQPSSSRLPATTKIRHAAVNNGGPSHNELRPQHSEPLPLFTTETNFAVNTGQHEAATPTGSDRQPETCLSVDGGCQEEEWEAFYFYHGGGMKDKFTITLSSATSRGRFVGQGTDKLGPFMMEGTPLFDGGGGETW